MAGLSLLLCVSLSDILTILYLSSSHKRNQKIIIITNIMVVCVCLVCVVGRECLVCGLSVCCWCGVIGVLFVVVVVVVVLLLCGVIGVLFVVVGCVVCGVWCVVVCCCVLLMCVSCFERRMTANQ